MESDLEEAESFFHSRAHYLTFVLLFTDGEVRNNLLNLEDTHYTDTTLAKAWLEEIVNTLTSAVAMSKLPSKQADRALEQLGKLYRIITNSWGN